MIIGGNRPIVVDTERWLRTMGSWTIDGRPVFPDVQRHTGLLGQQPWRDEPTWEERKSILARTSRDPVITDDNMVTEWWAFDTYP